MTAFDLPLGFRPADPGGIGHAAEEQGLDGVWSTEAGSDPYLPLALVAHATSRIRFGTAIAVAFPRSPLVHAQAAWDLHRMAPGRFILGLGAQVKAHNQRRYSAPFDHPAGRMRDLIGAIRAIWSCWQDGVPLDYRGPFYQHTLMTPFFSPGPVDHPIPPPIFLAAVGPDMLGVAGAVAEGVHVHPLHSEKSLDTLTLPRTREAALAAGRDPAALEFVVPFLVATGKDAAAVESARPAMRAQLAFYASTPAYRCVMECEGRGELADELHALSRRGGWGEMPERVDDELLDAMCVSATWDELPAALVRRYAGRATRIMPYAVADDGTPWPEIAAAFRQGVASLT